MRACKWGVGRRGGSRSGRGGRPSVRPSVRVVVRRPSVPLRCLPSRRLLQLPANERRKPHHFTRPACQTNSDVPNWRHACDHLNHISFLHHLSLWVYPHHLKDGHWNLVHSVACHSRFFFILCNNRIVFIFFVKDYKLITTIWTTVNMEEKCQSLFVFGRVY